MGERLLWLKLFAVVVAAAGLTACQGRGGVGDGGLVHAAHVETAAPHAEADTDAAGADPHAGLATAEEHADDPEKEARLLTNIRQLTFAGRRSGEGYFSADGRHMVFQSEREEGNPFYQIYLMDLQTGDTRRLSPGTGKTTCAWIHPDGERALFASTHHDPEAVAKQEAELAKRESGEQRRYEWDYDPHYDIFAIDFETEQYTQLTDAYGYNAEGAYSPDGQQIVFASNRHAYAKELSDEERERFERNPSTHVELYLMDADGGNVRRLTESGGYDGGPFFSADGSQIVWRRFDADSGHTAEIWTMDADGSNQRQVTDAGVMSWAPFFHPSGDYIIFTNNRYGFGNFELHIVDAAGERDPVRVTYSGGFDGLPVFTPDGGQLAWTSNRPGESQIFLADWDDAEARRLLGLDETEVAAETEAEQTAIAWARENLEAAGSPQITVEGIEAHVRALASEQMAGRLTGTEGERMATAYVAEAFRAAGLEPAGDDGGYYQAFDFTAGVSLGEDNALTLEREDDEPIEYQLDEKWRPVAFGRSGAIEPAPIVFAGYGIVAPTTDEHEAYNAYVHLDVQDKWVLVLRHYPEDVSEEQRRRLRHHASLRHKAMAARDRGARGIIFVSGPESEARGELVPLRFDASLSGTSIPAVSVTDAVAADWLAAADKDLAALHADLNRGELMMGFDLPGLSLAGKTEIVQERSTGRNVLARLPAAVEEPEGVVIIGGHVDHLGDGSVSGSLAHSHEEGEIHYGADDNASGVAALIEIAHYLADLAERGELAGRRDILFAAWSGEELGLIGSTHFAQTFEPPSHYAGPAVAPSPEAHASGGEEAAADDEADAAHAHSGADADADEAAAPRLPGVAAYLNMDMIGRYDDGLTVHGVGSSSVWEGLIERANVPVGLSVSTREDAYLPTDSTVFFVRGVPIVSAFTGVHAEYHTPRDTPDLINYPDTQRIARFMALLTRQVALLDEPLDYIPQRAPERGQMRAALRAFLGTVPDYAGDDVEGMRISGVSEGSPAQQAGLRGGDVVVELDGRTVENIYDYTYAIEGLTIGEETDIVVVRDGERRTFQITPVSRD